MVSTALVHILPLLIAHTYSLPYHYDKRNVRTGRVVSPGLTLGFSPGMESVRERYGKEGQGVVHKERGRMMGLDTGNPAADFEAGMWIAALIGTLTAAIPVAFLSPSLGFKKKRRSVQDHSEQVQDMMMAMQKVVDGLGKRDL